MAHLADTVTLSEPFELEGQAPLFDLRIAYRAWGEPRADNALVLLHGLSSSHDALGERAGSGYSPHGWARALFGPGAPLEQPGAWLVCPNLLASPFGSTRPADGLPAVTITDQARAVRALLRSLGVERARAVIGFSLGGTVALRFAALFPDEVEAVATIQGPMRLPTAVCERLDLQARRLLADPQLRPGDEAASRRALARARIEALRALYPRDWLTEERNRFAAERLLGAEAEEFARVFDPYCYLALLRCFAGADASGGLDWLEARSLVVACASDELATPESMLDTFNALCASGAGARYFELQGEAGHRAAFLEPEALVPALRELLAG
ncbi:MAG TPA: alpha/beta hydrolase [Myxococcales bacterium]|nr:alpha/beta hydrolase [Myxococcales bacterium]